MADHRSLPVPDGLDGERLDTALARMFGLSRTRAAEVIAAGDGRFAVVAGGRPSVTHYDTLEAFRAASLTEIVLETGRTHQIRVHMAAIRHPCVGDRLYGADPA